ncbi:unnamed protein product [Heterobilharzia americana]|nr:unnamed protein product [Heterobilharzia americana]
MQLLSVNVLCMLVMNFVVTTVSLNSEDNLTTEQIYTILVLSCVIFAVLLSILFMFVTEIHSNSPVNFLITLLAVILLSFSATLILANLQWCVATVVLSLTVIIVITTLIVGFRTRNLSDLGWTVFLWLSGLLIFVGLFDASLFYLLKQLTMEAGAFWSIGLSIIIFITIKILRFGRFDQTFPVVLFITYLLWLEELWLCFSITQCFIWLNDRHNICSKIIYRNFSTILY